MEQPLKPSSPTTLNGGCTGYMRYMWMLTMRYMWILVSFLLLRADMVLNQTLFEEFQHKGRTGAFYLVPYPRFDFGSGDISS